MYKSTELIRLARGEELPRKSRSRRRSPNYGPYRKDTLNGTYQSRYTSIHERNGTSRCRNLNVQPTPEFQHFMTLVRQVKNVRRVLQRPEGETLMMQVFYDYLLKLETYMTQLLLFNDVDLYHQIKYELEKREPCVFIIHCNWKGFCFINFDKWKELYYVVTV